MTRTLVLLRHGQTAWNAVDRAQGHADVPLDETGHAQAAAVAPYLAALRPSLLWSSDLTRACETAEHLATATGLAVHTDPRLREYDVGARSGLTRPEFAERFPREYAAWLSHDESVLVEGEETTLAVRDRVLAALTDCLAALPDAQTGVVVMHGACLKVALTALLGWPWELSRSLRGMDNCGWAVLTDDGPEGRLRLVSYNETVTVGRHPARTPGADFASDEAVG